LRTLGWVRSAEWPTDGWPCPVLDCQFCELALPLVPWLAGRVLGGLGPLLLRVSGVASLARRPPREDPSCVPQSRIVASDQTWERSGLNARRKLARSDPSPSFDSRPLPSARYVLPELLLLRTQDLCAPSHNGARMPKLGGARGARTRLKGALSVRLAGPLAAGGSRSRTDFSICSRLACGRSPLGARAAAVRAG